MNALMAGLAFWFAIACLLFNAFLLVIALTQLQMWMEEKRDTESMWQYRLAFSWWTVVSLLNIAPLGFGCATLGQALRSEQPEKIIAAQGFL